MKEVEDYIQARQKEIQLSPKQVSQLNTHSDYVKKMNARILSTANTPKQYLELVTHLEEKDSGFFLSPEVRQYLKERRLSPYSREEVLISWSPQSGLQVRDLR